MNCPKCEGHNISRRDHLEIYLLQMETYTISGLILYHCLNCIHEWYVLKGSEKK